MTFRVHILRRAERDAQQIFNWIAERSPDGAVRWWNAFESAVANLPENPTGHSFAPEDELTDYELRQFHFKTRAGRTYRGVFVVIGDEIKVLRVRGPGQPSLKPDELA